MGKEKQKMTLNVRRRATGVQEERSGIPPAVDLSKLEEFGSGVETKGVKTAPPKVTSEPKVIRDAFTMPATDHALFAAIQKKCLTKGIVVSKSEIVRAGLKHLVEASDQELERIIKKVPKIKTGRPKIEK